MIYVIIYAIVGAVIGVLSWFWNSSQHKDRIDEGGILIYLFGCIFLWPAVLISTIIDIIKFINKEYCSQEI